MALLLCPLCSLPNHITTLLYNFTLLIEAFSTPLPLKQRHSYLRGIAIAQGPAAQQLLFHHEAGVPQHLHTKHIKHAHYTL